MRVLKEPKNSLVKQYQTLMKLDSVELDITDEALHAIAKKTIALKSGARGLRSVMEQSLIGIMYEIPSDPNHHQSDGGRGNGERREAEAGIRRGAQAV